MKKISSRALLALSLLAILVLVTPKAEDITWFQGLFWAIGLVAIFLYGSRKDEN